MPSQEMTTAGLRYKYSHQEMESSPLFERQMNNDEYEELHQCKMVIDNLQQRVSKLEKINLDLEYRLEDQAKQTMAVEKECLSLEFRWKDHSEELENEINRWKAAFESEKMKGERLREHLSRTERELYGILQRKYEFMRGGPMAGKSGPKTVSSTADLNGIRRHGSETWDDDGNQVQSHTQVCHLFSKYVNLLISFSIRNRWSRNDQKKNEY
jgi:hypothetical protein